MIKSSHHTQASSSSESSHQSSSESNKYIVESIQGYVIFIKNIDPQVEEEQLIDLFSDFGRIVSLTFELSRRTGYHLGYALVKFESLEEAKSAIKGTNGKKLGKQALQVDWCFKPPVNYEREEPTSRSSSHHDTADDLLKRKRNDESATQDLRIPSQQSEQTTTEEPPTKKNKE